MQTNPTRGREKSAQDTPMPVHGCVTVVVVMLMMMMMAKAAAVVVVIVVMVAQTVCWIDTIGELKFGCRILFSFFPPLCPHSCQTTRDETSFHSILTNGWMRCKFCPNYGRIPKGIHPWSYRFRHA